MTQEIITTASNVSSRDLLGAELIEDFISFAGVCEKSASTYKIALRQLNKYFVANDISKPVRTDLENWRDKLIGEKKSPSTIQLYLTSAKIFFRWTAQVNLYPNIADHLKIRVKISHEHKKDALTARQAGTLIKSIKGTAIKSKRDKAILALMSATGLRTIEIHRADCADIICQFGRTYLLIQGKGHSSKDAKVLLPAQVVGLLEDYLSIRGEIDSSEPLFTSNANRNRGARLSTQ